MGPALRFSGVSLALGGTPILQDVSFSVEPGSLHCLIGPNGGGKSSLMRAVLGEMPITGEIAIEWRGDARTVGYVPQSLEFDRLLPVSVNDFMALISRFSAWASGIARRWPPRWSVWGLRARSVGGWAICPAASGSGCSLPRASCRRPPCCCSTNQ
jgi:zinc transport system ATP-binding protein